MRSMIALAAAGLFVAGGAFAQAQPQQQQQQQQAQGPGQQLSELQTAERQPFGEYLADAQGRALYMFTADEKGSGQSACTGPCAEAWPPAITQGQPKLGEEIDQSKLGTIQRQEGTSQVTYNGWPLYYFVQDQGPGQVTGQDKTGFGGEWYVVGPDGEPIKTSAQKAEAGEEMEQPSERQPQ